MKSITPSFIDAKIFTSSPENLKKYGIKHKEAELYLEISHADENQNTLKKQIIPLPTVSIGRTHEKAFNLNVISRYISRTPTDKYTTVALTSPSQKLNRSMVIHVPSTAGDFKFELWPNGNIELSRELRKANINIETCGDITTKNNCVYHDIDLQCKNFTQENTLSGQRISINPTDSATNHGHITADTFTLSNAATFDNHAQATLNARKTTIEGDIQITNQGKMQGSVIKIATTKGLENKPHAEIIADSSLDITFNEPSQNSGLLNGKRLEIKGTKFSNANEIVAEDKGTFVLDALDNKGKVHIKEGSGHFKIAKDFSHHTPTAEIKGRSDIIIEAKNFIVDAPLIASQTLKIEATDTLSITQQGKLAASTTLLSAHHKLQTNGSIKTQTLAIKNTREFEQLERATTQADKVISITGDIDVTNNGTLETENMDIRIVGDLDNLSKGRMIAEHLGLNVHGTISNANLMRANNTADIESNHFFNQKKGAVISEKDAKYKTHTFENNGRLSSNHGNITLESNNNFINTSDAEISVHRKLNLLVNEAQNNGAITANIIQAKGRKFSNNGTLETESMTIRMAGDLENLPKGRIIAEHLNLNVDGTISNANLIHANNTVEIEGGKFINHKKSTVITEKDANYKIHTFENNGRLASNHGNITLESSSNFINGTDAEIAVNETLNLAVNEAQNNGTIITNTMQTKGKKFVNHKKGRISSKNDADIGFKEFVHQGNISAKNIRFATDELELKMDSVVAAHNDIDISTNNVNSDGKLNSNKKIKIAAGNTLDIGNSGEFSSSIIELNADKKIASDGKITAHELHISDTPLFHHQQNGIATTRETSIKGAVEIINEGSLQGNLVKIDTTKNISNQDSGKIQSVTTELSAYQGIDNKGQITSDSINITKTTTLLTQKQSLISGKKSVTVSGDITLENKGDIQGQTLVINTTQSLENFPTGKIVADDLQMSLGKKSSNQNIVGAKKLSLTCPEFFNEKAGVLAGQEKAVITVLILDNSGSIETKNGQFNISEKFTNQKDATIIDQRNLNFSLASKGINQGRITSETLTIGGKEFSNEKDALVAGKKSVAISGDISVENKGDIQGQTLNISTTQSFENLSTGKVVADDLQMFLGKKSSNQNIIAAKKLSLTCPEFCNEKTGILAGEEKAVVTIPIFDNAGNIETKDGQFTLSTHFTNRKDAKIIDRGNLNFVIPEKGSNQGQITSETLKISGKTFSNEKDALLWSKKQTQVTVNDFKQVGKTVTEGSAQIKASTFSVVKDSVTQARGSLDIRTPNFSPDGTLTGLESLTIHSGDNFCLEAHGKLQSARLDIHASRKTTVKGEIIQQKKKDKPDVTQKITFRSHTIDIAKDVYGDEIEFIGTPFLTILPKGNLIISSDSPGPWRFSGKLVNHGTLQAPDIDYINPLPTQAIAAPGLASSVTQETAYDFINYHQVTCPGTFRFSGSGISHTQGHIQAHDFIITAKNILLTARASAKNNIDLHHLQGVLEVGEQIEVEGELAFYLPEGKVIDKPRVINGGLKYQLSPQAKKPLNFLADQKSKQGKLTVNTPTQVIVGSTTIQVTLLGGDTFTLTSSEVVATSAKLLAQNGMQIEANSIVIGNLPSTGIKPSAIQSNGDMHLKAKTATTFNAIEMHVGKDFSMTTPTWAVISSRLTVKGNALNNSQNSWFGMLTKTEPGGYIAPQGWNTWAGAHDCYRVIGESTQALSDPTHFQIGKTLDNRGNMVIFGSQVNALDFKGHSPLLQTFIVYKAWVDWFLCGHKKRHKAWWEHNTYMQTIKTFQAMLSIGGKFQVSDPTLDVGGIISAIEIELKELQQVKIGVETKAKLAPAPFSPRVSFLDVNQQPTALYELSETGSTVFQPILPEHFSSPEAFITHAQQPLSLTKRNENVTTLPSSPRIPGLTSVLGPVLVAVGPGIFKPNDENLRCLFSPEQEKQLLIMSLMQAIGRGFISKDLNDPATILLYLKENALKYSQNNSDMVVYYQGKVDIKEPLIVYERTEFTFTSGKKEIVLVPVLRLPYSYDNPRIRDGAGGLFSQGDIIMQGKDPQSRVLITGHLDAKKQLVFKDLGTVAATRRFTTEKVTRVNETTSKSITGNKTKRTEFTVDVIHPEPGNTWNAEKVTMENVNHFHMSSLDATIGKGGFHTENVTHITEQALVGSKIERVEEKKNNPLGSTKTVTYEVEPVVYPSRIHSEGSVNLKSSETGIYGALEVQAQGGKEISAKKLEWNVIPKEIAKNKALQLEQKEQQKKKAKKQMKKQVTLAVVGTFAGAGFATLLGPTLSSAFGAASGTMKLAFLQGATAGFVGAAVTGENLVKGAFFGAVTRGVNFAVKDLDTWMQIAIPVITNEAAHVVAGEKFSLENIGVGLVAQTVAHNVIPNSQATLGSAVAHDMIVAGVSSLVKGESLDAAMFAAGVAAAHVLAKTTGEYAGNAVHKQDEPKKKVSEKETTNEKDSVVLNEEQVLELGVQAITDELQKQNIEVDKELIAEKLSENSKNESGDQDNSTAKNQSQKNVTNNLEKALVATLNFFIGEVHAAEIYDDKKHTEEDSNNSLVRIFFGNEAKNVKIEYLYRGTIELPKEVFLHGFKARGTNEDLLSHIDPWDVGDGKMDSAYVSTSTSKKKASKFPYTVAKDSTPYLYEINPQANGIDLEKNLLPKGLCRDHVKIIRREKETAIPGKIKSRDIKGAWPVDVKNAEFDGEVYEEGKRIIRKNDFIKNPHYVPPAAVLVAKTIKFAGLAAMGVGATLDGISLYQAYGKSKETGDYRPLFIEAGRIPIAWGSGIALGIPLAKAGAVICAPIAPPIGSLLCYAGGGIMGSVIGYNGASEIVVKLFKIRQENISKQEISWETMTFSMPLSGVQTTFAPIYQSLTSGSSPAKPQDIFLLNQHTQNEIAPLPQALPPTPVATNISQNIPSFAPTPNSSINNNLTNRKQLN